MNLGKDINSLLRRYAEVYVPGIGVFKRIHSPAQFDKQNNVFLPPISYVELDYSAQRGFNIVHYIQQQEHLSLVQAQQILDDTVRALRNDLGQFGQAKLEDLGLLISYGSSLVFKPLDLSGFNFQPVVNLVGSEIETVIPVREDEHGLAEPDESVTPEPVHEASDEPIAISNSDAEIEEKAANEQQEPMHIENEGSGISAEPVAELVEPIAPTEEENMLDEDEDANVEAEPVPVDSAAMVAATDDNDSQEVAETEKIEQKEIGAIAAANSAYAPNIYEEEPRNSNAIWYWLTAAIVLVMIAVGVLYTNPGLKNSLFGGARPALKTAADTAVQKNNLPTADSSSNVLAADSLKKVDSLAKTTADSLKGTAVEVGKNTAAAGKAAPVLQADPVIKESIPVAQPKYQVVIGSARTMAQAEQEAKRLRMLGYKTARAVEGKYKRNRKKIILNTYMTKAEADLAQKSVAGKIEGAWVETL